MSLSFEPEWASPHEFAAMYRRLDCQVIPARPGAKSPLVEWVEFQNALVPQSQFDRWYGPTGEHRNQIQMGILTGACSRCGRSSSETEGLFCVDLDMGEGKNGLESWRQFVETYLNGIEPETWRARSGGGGRHIFFLAPIGWIPPTIKLLHLGLDVRDQGGFLVTAPSVHPVSKRVYEWESGFEPWACEIAMAPDELCLWIERERGPGAAPGAPREHTHTPASQTGLRQDDGREAKLAALVWAAVVDLRRESPIPPGEAEQGAELARLWTQYEQTTRSRLPLDDRSNAERLEAEGRGFTELRQKWSYAMHQWDGKVAEAAKIPKAEAPPEAAPAMAATLGEWDRVSLFEVLSMSDMANMPEVEWLIKDVLPKGGLALLFGAPGSFKTFVALDMAMTFAYDAGSWLGRNAKAGQSVLYIASEGSAGLYRRIQAWRRKHGLEGDSERFHMIRAPMSFMSAADIEKLVATVRAHVEAGGEIPSIIVVDTVSRVLPGADENLQKDMTVFIGACDRLRGEFAAAVLGVHHTNKAGDMRGSSVLNGAADAVFKVEREEHQPAGTLVCEKEKDAEDGWRAPFGVSEDEWIPAGQIAPVKSLVVDWNPAPGSPANPFAHWPPRAVLRTMQIAIQAAFDRGEPLSTAPQAKNSGRFAALVLANQFELKSRVVADVLKVWESEGMTETVTADPHTKKRGLRMRRWITD